MEGDVETIRALVNGETGWACKTVEVFLPGLKEEVTIVLFTLGDTLGLFFGTVEGEKTEKGFAFLMLIKCNGKGSTVLLILRDELDKYLERLGLIDKFLNVSEGFTGENLVGLNPSDVSLGIADVLALLKEDELNVFLSFTSLF